MKIRSPGSRSNLPRGLAEKVLAQRDKIEGERKQVTVLFCDMEGFTRFSEKLPPEESTASWIRSTRS